MITPIEPECVLSDRVFGDALGVVERSGAATLIDSYAAEARGLVAAHVLAASGTQ